MPWIAVALMGLVLGLLGGGGGILTVPILTGLFGLPVVEATGASLFIVGSTSFFGVLPSLVRKEVEVDRVLPLAISSLAGSFLSRRLVVPAIPDDIGGASKEQVLMGAFALLMVIVGVKMLLRPQPGSLEVKGKMSWFDPRIAAIGFSIGLVSGALGAGGGFLILPTLTLFMGIEMKRAVASSLLVIAVQSLAGFAAELGRPIRWEILLPILGVSLLGMVIGTALRPRINDRTLKTVFGVLVLVVAAFEGSQVAMNRF
jgi:uncharacterized membrane protein YfcA